MTSTLNTLCSMLDASGYSCTLVEEEPEHLQVLMGSTSDGENCMLHMTVVPTLSGAKNSEEPPPWRIQMHMTLPVPLKDSALENVSALLNFINNSIDMPGFYVDELNSRLFYRYMHFAPANRVDLNLLEALVGMIQLLPHLFLPQISQVASGEKTFDELLSEVVEDGKRVEEKRKEKGEGV